jgi:hypothetical protein
MSSPSSAWSRQGHCNRSNRTYHRARRSPYGSASSLREPCYRTSLPERGATSCRPLCHPKPNRLWMAQWSRMPVPWPDIQAGPRLCRVPFHSALRTDIHDLRGHLPIKKSREGRGKRKCRMVPRFSCSYSTSRLLRPHVFVPTRGQTIGQSLWLHGHQYHTAFGGLFAVCPLLDSLSGALLDSPIQF